MPSYEKFAPYAALQHNFSELELTGIVFKILMFSKFQFTGRKNYFNFIGKGFFGSRLHKDIITIVVNLFPAIFTKRLTKCKQTNTLNLN